MSNLMTENKNYSLGMTEVEARQVAEIRGKMVLARQFPRDTKMALERILQECENEKLAEVATYSFPRGESEVKGPTVRLAEVIASHWGNFTCGVTELEQRPGESTIKAYAWDLESNYSDEKIFTVPHKRVTKRKSYTLTDPRDIYEMVANQGARRKRACIFSVIPTYLVDEATEKCQETLTKSIGKEDIETVRAKMLKAFQKIDETITKEMLEQKAGKEFNKLNSKDIIRLRNLYNAINDGFVKATVAFGNADQEDEVVVDAEDKALTDQAVSAIFGDPEPTEAPAEPVPAEENTLTEEEKAEIAAMEAAEADQQEAGDTHGTD